MICNVIFYNFMVMKIVYHPNDMDLKFTSVKKKKVMRVLHFSWNQEITNAQWLMDLVFTTTMVINLGECIYIFTSTSSLKIFLTWHLQALVGLWVIKSVENMLFTVEWLAWYYMILVLSIPSLRYTRTFRDIITFIPIIKHH